MEIRSKLIGTTSRNIGRRIEHFLTERPAFAPSTQLFQVQGYLAHKNQRPPSTLQ